MDVPACSNLRWLVARLMVAGLATCLLQAAAADNDAQVSGPLGGGESLVLEPVPANPVERRTRAVFVCQRDGVPIYADRPCATDAAQRSMTVATPRPGAAATTAPPIPSASTRPKPREHAREAAPGGPADGRCETLRRQLDELNDRMRAGYSAREAARLWQRWRDAKQRLRDAHC